MHEAFTVLAAAIVMDFFLGDPRYPLHPVRLIGRLAKGLELLLWKISILRGRVGGSLLPIMLISLTSASYMLARTACLHGPGWLPYTLDVFTLYSCVALKDMIKHARPIADALASRELPKARESLTLIVARDTTCLDSAGVARATVESVAESFVDGFLGPVFWMVAGILIGAAFRFDPLVTGVISAIAYRCVNTLDSMVGYKNGRYRRFGTVSALADDMLNFLPARLSLPLLWMSAAILRMKPTDGWRIAMRDRLNHASPNSAHAESFVAGALSLKLGGPANYPHGWVEKPEIGDGTRHAEPKHIIKACRLTFTAALLTLFVTGTLVAVTQ